MDLDLPKLDLKGCIAELEHRVLDSAVAPSLPPIWGDLVNLPLVRVLGQAAFWEVHGSGDYAARMDDVITSAAGQGAGLYYVVVSRNLGIEIYLGLDGMHGEELLRTMLSAVFPGVRLGKVAERQLGRKLEQEGLFAYSGRLTGVPTRKVGPLSQGSTPEPRAGWQRPASQGTEAGAQVDRLLRGLRAANWGVVVRAKPHNQLDIIAETYWRLQQIQLAASMSKLQLQHQGQRTNPTPPWEQASESRSIAGEIVNREAQYAVELLERELERLTEGKAVGMWDTDTHFFAADDATFRRVQLLLRAMFAGAGSSPQPIRTFACGASQLASTEFTTRLTSLELATLAQLPQEEVAGYSITDYAPFDLDKQGEGGPGAVALGQILDGGQATGVDYRLAPSDLTMHALVTGVTGSGKTNTIFHLLTALRPDRGPKVPFLVIEPAKAEYRALRGRQDVAISNTKATVPDLRIYTLGDENVAPFRLNPFAFELGPDDQGIHVQTHIDYLKSVFNAAFILYAPMPYVLDMCLHEIYIDKGWDLTTSRNGRLPGRPPSHLPHWPMFPTLTDLYTKIDEVSARLGYDSRIEMDVKAGLKARIGALRLGSKGLMLDTQYSVPMSELLSEPTVLELERLGNDEEKAFLMGLILMRLYEFRRVEALTRGATQSIRHVTVIEEAHRLLKNVPTEIATEEANVRGHALEAFVNMLSEVRAYGEGMVIAEQIPTKLAQDVIKNTSLKIVHRLIAQDDREALGAAANMIAAQIRHLSVLRAGCAVVSSAGDDRPYLVGIKDCSYVKHDGAPRDPEVAKMMSNIRQPAAFAIAPDYDRYSTPTTNRRPLVNALATTALSRPEFTAAWNSFFMQTLLGPAKAIRAFAAVEDIVARTLGSQDDQRPVTIAVSLRAAHETLQARGHMYGWDYAVVEGLRQQLVDALMALIQQQPNHLALFQAFAGAYQNATRRQHGPFVGCEPCQARCLYRFDVLQEVSEPSVRHEWIEAARASESESRAWHELASLCWETAHQVVGEATEQNIAGAALCVAIQMTAQLGYRSTMQREVSEGLANVFKARLPRA